MDLSKLSPAPLEVRRDPTELRCKALAYQYEYEPREFASVWFAREMKEDDAEWVKLARSAFDVMMRRGWFAVPMSTGGWIVKRDNGIEVAVDGKWATRWPDPFTALVEADRWMKEQEA